MNSDDILDSILGGNADDALDNIMLAVRDRQKNLARRTASALKEGDAVRFNERIRPKYLVGVEATVVRVNDTTVTVKITDPEQAGRFGQSNVRCPMTLIEPSA